MSPRGDRPDVAFLHRLMPRGGDTDEEDSRLSQTLGTLSEAREEGAETGAEETLLTRVSEDRYEGGARFGSGGMGTLRAAVDRRLRRAVLIKELRPERLTRASHRRRFEREIFISASLQHPGIVNVHDGGRWPSGEPFYSMQRVQGQDFNAVIATLESHEERLAQLQIVVDVANAMAYAHSQGVIHRDLKPANVLVGRFGETVVIDWGLAKLIGEPEELPYIKDIEGALKGDQTRQAGTLAYMPPEQAAGDAARLDERADVFAIGAILYHLMSGAPWPRALDEEFFSAAFASGQQHPRPISDVVPGLPPALATIIHTAMASEPEARYRDAGALAEELRRFTAGQLVRSHAYSARELVRRWIARHKALVTTVGVALVILIAVIVVSFVQVTGARDKNARQRDKNAQQRDEIIQQRDEIIQQRDENARQRDENAAHLERIRALSLAELRLRGPDTGASILIDGERVGEITGLSHATPIELDPGAHVITLTREGFLDEPVRVHLKPQDEQTLTVLMRVASTGAPEGMVSVPGGLFTMGSRQGAEDEQPERAVALEAFFIDQREVRVSDYLGCVEAGRCEPPLRGHEDHDDFNWGAPERARHPVNGVSWFQAQAYCAWVGKRLVGEAEWEKAARGVDARRYPWGDDDEVSCARAVMWDHSGFGCGRETTWPAGSRPQGASPYGALDMAGNVAEWTADWYAADHYKDAEGSRPEGPNRGLERVARGGSFGVGPALLTTTRRLKFNPDIASSDVGFRCASSPPSEPDAETRSGGH